MNKKKEVMGYRVDLSECKSKTVSLKGIIDPELLKEWKEEMDSIQWCECKDSPGAYYVGDTPEMKHHWCCEACDKVVQIG